MERGGDTSKSSDVRLSKQIKQTGACAPLLGLRCSFPEPPPTRRLMRSLPSDWPSGTPDPFATSEESCMQQEADEIHVSTNRLTKCSAMRAIKCIQLLLWRQTSSGKAAGHVHMCCPDAQRHQQASHAWPIEKTAKTLLLCILLGRVTTISKASPVVREAQDGSSYQDAGTWLQTR